MKVIELLNKIANGEEVPKKIKYEKQVYELTENKIDWYCYDYKINFLGNEITLCNLNDEIEIIEPQEHKIPEKLKLYKLSDNYSANTSTLQDFNNKNIQITINEILDYLEVNNDRKGS